MKYPSFKDHNGLTWNIVTIHITVSPMCQAEIECQTPGEGKTKTFCYSVHTGMLSQLDPSEICYSVPDDSQALCKALGSLFSAS